MQTNIVTLDRFKALLAAYGPDPARWPREEQNGAEVLLRISPEARQLRDAEAEAGLDALLDSLTEPAPASARLRMAVVQEAVFAKRRSGWQRWWRNTADLVSDLGGLGGLRPAGVALAASLCLGFLAGGFVTPAASQQSNVDIVELALLSDAFTGY